MLIAAQPAITGSARGRPLLLRAMICPLCESADSRPSWLGETSFRGSRYAYRECGSCGSLFCDPMPDGDALAAMYTEEYIGAGGAAAPRDPGKMYDEVLEVLAGREPGHFVDFGCGAGRLLHEARGLAWRVTGVEFGDDAARPGRGAGLPIVTTGEVAGIEPADVLHLGDVVEHLTTPGPQLQDIMWLVRPGGLLIAQGPLENERNLVHGAVRAIRRIRPAASSHPPYHVLLATERGQRRLFARVGLGEQRWRMTEVAWPAPQALGREHARAPRAVALFALRRVSKTMGRVVRGPWGNRYLYVGRVPASSDA
jgi:SAM-dependent methyltransferase